MKPDWSDAPAELPPELLENVPENIAAPLSKAAPGMRLSVTVTDFQLPRSEPAAITAGAS